MSEQVNDATVEGVDEYTDEELQYTQHMMDDTERLEKLRIQSQRFVFFLALLLVAAGAALYGSGVM